MIWDNAFCIWGIAGYIYVRAALQGLHTVLCFSVSVSTFIISYAETKCFHTSDSNIAGSPETLHPKD